MQSPTRATTRVAPTGAQKDLEHDYAKASDKRGYDGIYWGASPGLSRPSFIDGHRNRFLYVLSLVDLRSCRGVP